MFSNNVPAVPAGGQNLSYIMQLVTAYFNDFLVLVMAVAVVLFVFNVVKYFMMPGADRKEAGNYVMYSVLGFFVILAFWGLVRIVQNTFHLNGQIAPSTTEIYNSVLPK